MGLVIRVADKIVFASLFLLALQIPILADHYRQYLSGFYDATAEQVNNYQALADQFGYASVGAMIDTLKQNPNPLVQQDATNKAQTVASLTELREGLIKLQQGHYFEKAWYMFAPQRKQTLSRVIDNFAPSVPLSPDAILFSLITAIAINLMLWSPFWTAKQVKQWRHRHAHPA